MENFFNSQHIIFCISLEMETASVGREKPSAIVGQKETKIIMTAFCLHAFLLLLLYRNVYKRQKVVELVAETALRRGNYYNRPGRAVVVF